MASSPDRDQDQVRARRRRKDAGQPRYEDRDYYVLQWIAEQGAIRFDQLQRLLGRASPELDDWTSVLSESATRNAIDRWSVKRYINAAYLVPKEQKYFWLSTAGLQFIESSLPHYSPKRSEMSDVLACNQARLHVELLNLQDDDEFGEYDACTWSSRRALLCNDPDRTLHVPVAEFETGTRGTLAIEVMIEEPGPVAEKNMRAYAQGKLGNYSEIWYYALSEPLVELDAIREKLRQERVDVSRIFTFKADHILIPPPRPKRVKKKKSS